MLHKELHEEIVRLHSANKFFCVHLLMDANLMLVNKDGTSVLHLNRKPLPEHEPYVKLDPSAAERSLQTKIRAKVRDHLDFLRPSLKSDVNKNSGVLDPTVQIRLF